MASSRVRNYANVFSVGSDESDPTPFFLLRVDWSTYPLVGYWTKSSVTRNGTNRLPSAVAMTHAMHRSAAAAACWGSPAAVAETIHRA